MRSEIFVSIIPVSVIIGMAGKLLHLEHKTVIFAVRVARKIFKLARERQEEPKAEKHGKYRNTSREDGESSAFYCSCVRFQVSGGNHFGIEIADRVENILFFHMSISSFCKCSLSFLRVRKRSMLTALSFIPLPFAIEASG